MYTANIYITICRVKHRTLPAHKGFLCPVPAHHATCVTTFSLSFLEVNFYANHFFKYIVLSPVCIPKQYKLILPHFELCIHGITLFLLLLLDIVFVEFVLAILYSCS